ncbi:MAG: hypothetical protein JWQ66_4187 [Mucilaginibacter sp.]|nr:hypothetical protein [Mucilaginibacter sp.]
MLLLKISTLAILLLIFLQDLKARAVYWFLFPLLAVMLVVIRFQHPVVLPELAQSAMINIGFILVQLIILTLYFSLKSKQWINISNGLLGLGDILFLMSIAFYLSVLNFLFFYISSLIGVLLLWLIGQAVSLEKNKYIPLAGLQSLIFIVFLTGDWWCWSFNLTDDTWLLNLIAR